METNTATTTTGSEDPVAEFLAREQSVLGDLEDDLIVNKVDGETAATTTTNTSISQPQDDDLFNSSNDIKINGDINGDLENGDIANLSNGISDISINKESAQQLPPSMLSQQPIIPAEEPESIKRWREQHLKNLEKKDEEEKKKIEELRQQAKKELEEWYQRYQEQLEKTKKQNRAAEKEWIAERDNEQPPGQAWEKISRMCDFNPKTSRNQRDTSRMRSMLLQLKQNPPASSSSSSSTANPSKVSS